MEAEFNNDLWRIKDFSDKVIATLRAKLDDPKYSMHHNSIDRWFVEMEAEGIHYVNRVGKKRAYNHLDMQIACFIGEMRELRKWQLQDIYQLVKEQFDVREFPEETTSGAPSIIDEALIEQRIIEKVGEQLKEMQASINIQKVVADEVNRQMKKMLPPPVDMQKETQIRMKAEILLEEEAVAKWQEQPEDERLVRIKTGIFSSRLEEDYIKRDTFIRAYKKKHLDEFVELAYSTEKESTQ